MSKIICIFKLEGLDYFAAHSTDFFNDFDDDAFRQVLHNIAFRLKPNGLLIVSDVVPQKTLQTSVHVRNRALEDNVTCLPDFLGWLDRRFMLPRYGIKAPNSKWLLAVKSDVA